MKKQQHKIALKLLISINHKENVIFIQNHFKNEILH
jgi:hypothetical protein